jgi:DNA-binding HxlR family transcriptional regulator
MRGYGQYCPVAKAAEVFAERWMPLVLRELLSGATRFNDLHRGVPLMSRSLLVSRLRRLEEIGAVVRSDGPGGGRQYHLTAAGTEFAPIIQLLGEWGQRWYRSKFDRDELDVGVLMWDMHRGVRADAFPPGRSVIQFDFRDQPVLKRSWWMICNDREIDICPTNPGFDVDLYVASDLRTMSRVWMGDLGAQVAVRSGEIRLSGQRDLRQGFEQWLGLSRFAPIEDAWGPPRKPTYAVRAPMPEPAVRIPH